MAIDLKIEVDLAEVIEDMAEAEVEEEEVSTTMEIDVNITTLMMVAVITVSIIIKAVISEGITTIIFHK